MNYFVMTSKHHEGFALFKSYADKFNVVDATALGRFPAKAVEILNKVGEPSK